MSANHMSVDQKSVGQMSVDQMSVGQMSVDQMSVDQMVSNQKSQVSFNIIKSKFQYFTETPAACRAIHHKHF